MKALIVPKFQVKELSLVEAVADLEKLSILHDPREVSEERKGVNIIVDERAIQREIPKALDTQLTFDLQATPLSVLLEYLTELAGVDYFVETYAVVVRPIVPANHVVQRRYHVPRGAIVQGAKAFLEEKGIQFIERSSAVLPARTRTAPRQAHEERPGEGRCHHQRSRH